MCQMISGIAVLTDGDKIKVYTSETSDSHSDIREEFGIRDDNSPIADRQTPVELIPVESLTDVNGMEFRFDAGKPNWWTDDMTDETVRQLYRALKNRWNKDRTVFEFAGHINLNNLRTIPAGITMKSGGGGIYLDSLQSIAENVTLQAKGSIYLDSLQSIPENVTLQAKGSIYLNSLQSIPDGVTLVAGRALHLKHVTSIADGVTLVGENIILISMKAMPEKVAVTSKCICLDE